MIKNRIRRNYPRLVKVKAKRTKGTQDAVRRPGLGTDKPYTHTKYPPIHAERNTHKWQKEKRRYATVKRFHRRRRCWEIQKTRFAT